jgi:hypothetical protein
LTGTTYWHNSGVDTVLSLLSSDQEQTLGQDDEAGMVIAQEMDFISLRNLNKHKVKFILKGQTAPAST